ncbi:MAG: DUF1552 domain-containing protein [Myxococcales bacterium]|nr:DUF1552 domain-containing protein [Myxococcales bacterium]
MIALPLLDIMGCESARTGDLVAPRAAALDPGGELNPRRLCIVVQPNGTLRDEWFPRAGAAGAATETDFTLNHIMGGLERHRSRVTVLKGVHNRLVWGGHFHGTASLLTGTDPTFDPDTGAELPESQVRGLSISVDQAIARHIVATDRTAPADLALALGTMNQTGSGIHDVSYTGPRTQATKLWNPVLLWERLFSTPVGDDDGSERRRRRRASILDDVRDDYVRLQPKLGRTDRERLEQHVDAIREIERRLSVTTRECSTPLRPNAEVFGDFWQFNHRLPEALDLTYELIRLAFACDRTRVVTLLMRMEGQSGGEITFPWLGIGKASDPDNANCGTEWTRRPDCEPNAVCNDRCQGPESTEHHALSHYEHHPGAYEKLKRINRWYCDQFAGFADALARTTEGTGSVLDSSVLMYTSGIARGDHSVDDMPFLLVGSAGGRLRTGRFLDYGRSGRSHNDLLLALLHAFGATDATFGAPAHNGGPLPGLLA